MSNPTATIGPDDAPRLRDEHAFLERQLAEAIALAEENEWKGFELRWQSFKRAFEQHLRYEENLILPTFRKSESADKQEAQSIHDEHYGLRSEVSFLDRTSQQPSLFLEQLRELYQVLRAHQAQEERVLYPWLASLPVTEVLAARHLLDTHDSTTPTPDSPWKNPTSRRARTASE